MSANPTPSPWRVQATRGGGGESVVVGEHTGIDCLKRADADLIVRAVNSHPRFLALLTHCVAMLNATDAEHDDFMDSCADACDFFWNHEKEIRALAKDMGIPAAEQHPEEKDTAAGAEDDKLWFLNFYRCPCGAEWQDEWDCTCNDRCPTCNAEIEPYKSEDAS